MERKLLFSAKEISKNYGATHALKGVDLDVYEGEIIGLVGENGAGKSTLLKIIIGSEGCSSGSMLMHDAPYAPHNPLEANAAGVGMVFQEQSLIVNLSVGQNVFFGHEKDFRRFGVINWPNLYRRTEDVLKEIGNENIPARKKVSDLNFATRQMVEIAKVLNVTKRCGGRKCLVLLDEPTSVLNEDEIGTLFTHMRKIVALGHSVIFVSHRLEEIIAVTNRIYVFKDGTCAGDLPTTEASEKKLYEMMVGHSTTSEYYKLDRKTAPRGEVVLEARNLGLMGVFKNISFSLYKGEILGLCGVVGSGKEGVCEVLCGDEKPTSGELLVNGAAVRFKSPAQALKRGILMVPKERLAEGIIRTRSVEDNIALSNLEMLSKSGVIQKRILRLQANEWIKRLRIKTSGSKELLMQLSGGNQQKVVFSRALASLCDILILNHPTRGVDVGAKEEIYALIRDMVADGKAVILLGDTLDESIGMSNRILVMKDGMITGEFEVAADKKPDHIDIISAMM